MTVAKTIIQKTLPLSLILPSLFVIILPLLARVCESAFHHCDNIPDRKLLFWLMVSEAPVHVYLDASLWAIGEEECHDSE
jgi:hypothetical protein